MDTAAPWLPTVGLVKPYNERDPSPLCQLRFFDFVCLLEVYVVVVVGGVAAVGCTIRIFCCAEPMFMNSRKFATQSSLKDTVVKDDMLHMFHLGVAKDFCAGSIARTSMKGRESEQKREAVMEICCH
jgi:hypothetical protein